MIESVERQDERTQLFSMKAATDPRPSMFLEGIRSVVQELPPVEKLKELSYLVSIEGLKTLDGDVGKIIATLDEAAEIFEKLAILREAIESELGG